MRRVRFRSAEASTTQAEFPVAPDAAMKFIAKELAQGNGGVLWQAMPSSYQSDLNEIVHWPAPSWMLKSTIRALRS